MTLEAPRVARTLVIVDDSADFLVSASAMLAEEGFDVLAGISDATQVVAEVRRLGPAVVLVDVQMPLLDGFQIADQLAKLARPPMVVLISSREAESYGADLRAAPVRGFISKWELSGRALASMV
jgi:DNA-binding NarL/FixJ family response regulator